MILTVNIDYFLKQRQPADLCNGEVWCFLCGTDWIKYYLDEFRLQAVNYISVLKNSKIKTEDSRESFVTYIIKLVNIIRKILPQRQNVYRGRTRKSKNCFS
jgi:hypothetical protein